MGRLKGELTQARFHDIWSAEERGDGYYNIIPGIVSPFFGLDTRREEDNSRKSQGCILIWVLCTMDLALGDVVVHSLGKEIRELWIPGTKHIVHPRIRYRTGAGETLINNNYS